MKIMKRAICLMAAALLVTAVVIRPTSAAFAAENGMGFYILGQRSQGAGVLPPVEGVFFSMSTYYYSGDAGQSEELPFNGTADLGVDAELFIVMPTAIWVTPLDVFGGDLAFSGTYVYGNADLSVDDRWTAGDPVFSTLVGWHGENQHYLFAASVNVPAGSDYDDGRLANVALNRWAGDITIAGTWLFPQESIELSGATGMTFNGKNDDTDYRTGTEFHLEASVFINSHRHFPPG